MTLPPSCRWTGDCLELLDQRQLPDAVAFMQLHGWQEVAEAITSMAVRGAPAIGIAAAWGGVLGARPGGGFLSGRAGWVPNPPGMPFL